ncbi:MAG TPA: PepSY domain-containing protein [Aquabacterium sp.]|uniref:PepSY-associated TM helix domain-containing protein n=1 Tax=Aquabacterium sp. TaxID=1872578 RepID=UPI002E31287D|nr:PepSY domain-containing protein [Aquabacterium sp.]HEX5371591.1 PepSY domain-containing protein [Aquabacterium sp.]
MTPSSPSSRAARDRLFWRAHFWAGLITAPIVVFAALSGLLYVFSPQIEVWRHADVDRVSVPASAQALPLDRQVQAALAATQPEPSAHAGHGAHHGAHHGAPHPGPQPRFVVPALQPGDTTQVAFRTTGSDHDHDLPQGQTVYVNPYTGQVVGTLADMARFKTWAKKLHSTALQGDGWRWLLELATSWMLVMMITGLTMWWPRSVRQGGPGWRALWPRWGQGRLTWRDLHASVAIVMGLVLCVILITGLTWSKYTGVQFKTLQTALHQDTARPPKGLRSQVPEPGEHAAPALNWQQAFERARAQAPQVSMMITPPQGPTGVWKIDNFDRSQPTARFSLVLDQYSGTPLFFAGWADMPAMSRATAVGIPFHRGEFGLWNQLLLVLVALSALFSVVSGVVMWWQRRPQGRAGAPRLSGAHVRALPWWLWPLLAAMAYAMPVFGISVLVCLALESLRLLHPLTGPASSA